MLIVDDDRRYVEANRAACRLLRLSRRDILRRRIGDFSEPAAHAQIARLWRRFLSHGTLQLGWPLTLPGGSVRYVEFVARANFLPGLHLGSVRSVHAHKRAETQQARLNQRLKTLVAARTSQLEKLNARLRNETARQCKIAHALRHSEQRYRALFNRANDAILIIDPASMTILEANACARSLYGFGRKPGGRVKLTRHLADPFQERRHFRAVMGDGGRRTYVSQRFRRDGNPISVEVHAAAVDYNGRRALLSIGRDVTAQQHAKLVLQASEQRLRAAMEASLNAVFTFTAVRNARGRITDFRFTEANARGLAFVGATRRQLLGGLMCELMPINRTAGFFARYVKVVETGKPLQETFQLEAPWRRTKWDGPKWLHHQVVRLGDGMLITVSDITEQKRMEEDLRALPRQLTQAQEAERRRVARDLHDGVNQMLAAAHIALRHAQELGTDQAALRAKLLANAIKAVGQTVVEVRRISHGLRPSALNDLGLSAALSGLLTDFADRTGIGFEWSRRRPVPRIPPAPAEVLYRIAQEALANVERHSRANRVTVGLGVRRGRVTLALRDNGRGFILGRMDPVSGYGLLHMRERAEFAGGTLVVTTAPGRGTKIAVSLPLPA